VPGGQFDFEKVGCLLACKEGNKFHIVDGGHRWKWMGEAHPNYEIDGTPIWIRVQIVTDKVAMFLASNNRLKVTPNTAMKCRKNNGDEPELFVHNTLIRAGIGILYEAHGRAPLGTTRNPAAFLRLYYAVNNRKSFKEVVSWFVNYFARPDGEVEEAALQADFIKGMAWMMQHTAHDLDTIGSAFAINTLSAAEIVQKGRKAAETGTGRWKEIGKLLSYIVNIQQKKAA
jgi:hypothetical protein